MARCPITGEAAVLTQEVGVGLLRGLWRWSFGVAATTLPDRGRIGLWRSPCGLMFFDPPCVGDGAFYEALYRRVDAPGVIRRAAATRPEYRAAAAHLRVGASVLDVGAGPGAFAPPGVRVVGIDPHAAEGGGVLRESVAAHAARVGAVYDAVTAFQVIEHVGDPVALASGMMECLRPGGVLMLGAPLWPSPMTAIPNFCLNAPPHHASWWNEGAMRALAERVGLEVREVVLVGPAPGQPLIHWMGRLAPMKARAEGPWFVDRWWWHGSLLAAWVMGVVAARVRAIPADAAAHFLLLVAEKPMR